MFQNRKTGFTLAELLISLAILGVIATFTIPKVLNSSSEDRYNANAKEHIAAISQAFQTMKQQGVISSSTKGSDFIPYLNYVKLMTVGQIDHHWNAAGSIWCDNTSPCVLTHDGGVIQFQGWTNFGGTSTTHLVMFFYDPDGKVTNGGSAQGPGKSINFYVKYNGKVGTRALIAPGRDGNGTYSDGDFDPPWFKWGS